MSQRYSKVKRASWPVAALPRTSRPFLVAANLRSCAARWSRLERIYVPSESIVIDKARSMGNVGKACSSSVTVSFRLPPIPRSKLSSCSDGGSQVTMVLMWSASFAIWACRGTRKMVRIHTRAFKPICRAVATLRSVTPARYSSRRDGAA